MAHKTKQRAPAMSRELTSLYLENQTVPVALDQFQAKPKLAARAERWAWRGFKSSARGDELVLHHWAKASEQPTDYFYARFNARTKPYEYTDDEYAKCIGPLDGGWTREETDYLLHLCRQFDLRFLVIHDRYYTHPDCPGTGVAPGRALEDLKARYYAIGRALMQHRAGEDALDPEDVPLQATNKLADDLELLQFDKDKELERKQHLEALFRRTRDEIEEEELLVAEARRIEANERRLVHEREALLQAHAMFEEAAASAVGPPVNVQFAQAVEPGPASPSATPGAEPVPKVRRGSAPDEAATPRPLKKQKSAHGAAMLQRGRPAGTTHKAQEQARASPGAALRSPPPPPSGLAHSSVSPGRGLDPRSERSGSPPQFGVPTFSTEDHAVKPAVTTVDAPDIGPITIPLRDARLGPGVFLRSDKLFPIAKNRLDAVKQFMSQLSLNSPNTIWPRPTMVTAAVCDRFDSLQTLIIPLLDYKKAADKLEAEVQVLRARRRMLVSELGAQRAEAALGRPPPADSTRTGPTASAGAGVSAPAHSPGPGSARHQRKGSSSASGRKKSRDAG
ncbi:swr complex subunit [Coemansia biformis]|uniref:SWR1-complex protein 4 n=1 Tax=Coemansia biformis TaxID=1286918 RepID=A0A9W7YAL5_9FUNG|nr:swr complex subunit [Coemansia biformis]